MNARRLAPSSWFGFALILALASPAAHAQPPYMVADLSSQTHRDFPGTVSPMEVAELNGVGYFFQNDGVHGSELWRTDGTALGTYLLRDLCPGLCGARDLWAYSNLATAAGALFFVANDGVHGNELWLTDGSALGTRMVRDIAPGRLSSSPSMFTPAGGQVFFIADDDSHGRELWRSDGTLAGTYLVADMNPGRPAGGVSIMAASQERLYLSVSYSTSLQGLWVSDGSGPGTFRISEVHPWDNAFYKSRPFVVLPNGTLVFRGTLSGQSDTEPWVSDGTSAGTVRLVDLVPGPGGSEPWDFVLRGNEVVFTAETDGSIPSPELWRTDGTEGGTVEISVPPGLELWLRGGLHALAGNTLYFAALEPATGLELWKLEGDVVSFVRDIRPGADSSINRFGFYPFWNQALFAAVGSRVLLLADDGVNGLELWSSDGTEAGTLRVSELAPGVATPFFDPYLQMARPPIFGDRLLLREYDADLGYRLWLADGTVAGTEMIETIAHSSSSFFDVHAPSLFYSAPGPFCATAAGTRLVFETYSASPEKVLAWGTDGSPSGTELLGIPPGTNDSFRLSCAALGNLVFLIGGDETTSGLWRTDGRASGTSLLDDLLSPGPGTSGTSPLFVPFGQELAFGENGSVWRTTGEDNGTGVVSALEEYWPNSLASTPDGRLFFSGFELNVSDGTPETTFLVADLNGANGSYPTDLTSFGAGLLLFSSLDDLLGEELWVTDGTPEATQLVRDIFPGADSGFGRAGQDYAGAGPEPKIAALSSVAVLRATDGVHGFELWVTDGTALGTGLLKDIFPGDYPSSPQHFTRLGNRIVFSAEDEEHGLELWVTDGTYDGTALLKDVAPGTASSVPDDLVVQDGLLYFSAWAPNYGREAWRSDGTAGGTVRITDVAPGPKSSSPQRFARAGNRLYFSATDQIHGYELWAISDDGSFPLFLDGFESSDMVRWSAAVP